MLDHVAYNSAAISILGLPCSSSNFAFARCVKALLEDINPRDQNKSYSSE